MFSLLLISQVTLFQAQTHSAEAQSLLDSSYYYSRYDYDKCIRFADSALFIDNQNKEYVSKLSDYYVGICNNRHGQYEEALQHFENGIKNFELLKDTNILSDLYYQKSLVYRQQSEYTKFLENVNKSQSLAEATNYYTNIGMCYNAKLIHFNERKRFKKAEECGLKALEIFQSLQDSSSLGDVYNNLGVLMYSQKKYEQALKYHLLQHELNTELGNKWGKGYSHSKLATVYAKEGRYILAKSNMNEALKITRTIGTPYELSGALMRSASLNASIGNSEQAIKDIHESIHLSKTHHQLNSYADGLSELVKIHRNQAYLDSALIYSELLMTVKDSVLNGTIGKELAELEVKFDTEKKDKEILKLQLADQLKEARITQQTIIIISSLLGLGLLTLLYFRIKAKNEKIKEQNSIINKALIEKDVLLKEIHHRVKNNLQMISSLLGIQSRTIKDKKAKEAIQVGRTRVYSMSLLHQNLYQKDNLSGVPMEDYLPKLCHNLFDTYNINGEYLSLTTNIEAIKLDVETVIPLGLIVNELITNALKYAFPNDRLGVISVELKEENECLILAVEDDGVGFPETKANDTHNGFGHKLISAFKEKLNADIKFTHTKGTKIELLIRSYKKM